MPNSTFENEFENENVNGSLPSEDEAEDTPDPYSTLQQLTDEFTGKLHAAGLFEYFEVDIETWMCSLDRLVSTKFMG
jgi:hypothetical protein